MTTDSGPPLVMAFETSCDETAVAILRGKNGMLASEVASQIALHRPHGGVVPEVASRSHLTQLKPLIARALESAGVRIGEIGVFAATSGPGLASSLMIGVSAAKGLALGLRKPFLAVNHLEGHLLSPFFGREEGVAPCVALVVSGGHTLLVEIGAVREYRVLGQTQDDAAGEAFDKVGKMLGLPYPGGPEIDRLARGGDPERLDFPRSMMRTDDFNFSFSGLKTAVRTLLPKLRDEKMPDICASFQEAVVDVLVHKTILAAKAISKNRIAVSGGVSCNSRLREKLGAACARAGIELLVADAKLCTDNAAMIAYVAAERIALGQSSPITADIDPNLRLI
jgi:N6-L-threonylcarbamoyladenine synthase